MSVTIAPRMTATAGQIQRMFDENNQLIQAIADFQKRGKSQDCIHYQHMLHRNLLYLTSMTNSAQSANQLLPPPTQPSSAPSAATAQLAPQSFQPTQTGPPPQSLHPHQTGMVGSMQAHSLYTVVSAGPVQQQPNAYTSVAFPAQPLPQQQPPSLAQPAPSATQHHFTHPNLKSSTYGSAVFSPDTPATTLFGDESQPPMGSNTIAAQSYSFQMNQPTTILPKETPMIIKQDDESAESITSALEMSASNKTSIEPNIDASAIQSKQIAQITSSDPSMSSINIDNQIKIDSSQLNESQINQKTTSFDSTYSQNDYLNPNQANVDLSKSIKITTNQNNNSHSNCSPNSNSSALSVAVSVNANLSDPACNSDSLDALEPSLSADFASNDSKESVPSFQSVSNNSVGNAFLGNFSEASMTSNTVPSQYQYNSNAQMVSGTNGTIVPNQPSDPPPQPGNTFVTPSPGPQTQMYQLPNGNFVSAPYNTNFVTARPPNVINNQQMMNAQSVTQQMMMNNNVNYSNPSLNNAAHFSNPNQSMNQTNTVAMNSTQYAHSQQQPYSNTYSYSNNGPNIPMSPTNGQLSNSQWFGQTQNMQHQSLQQQPAYMSNQQQQHQGQMMMQNQQLQQQYQMHANQASPQMQIQLQQQLQAQQQQQLSPHQQQSPSQTYGRAQTTYAMSSQMNYTLSPKPAMPAYAVKQAGFPGQHQFAADQFPGSNSHSPGTPGQFGAAHYVGSQTNVVQQTQQQQMIASPGNNTTNSNQASMTSPQQSNQSQWFVQ